MGLRRKWQDPDSWHEGFINIICQAIKPKISIEVGVAHGVVTRILSKSSEHVFAIDIDAAPIAGIEQLTNVTGIIGDSPIKLQELSNRGVKADIIFIDGDHRIDAAIKDFNEALKLVQLEGLILMHDTYPRNKDFVSEKNEVCSTSYLVPDRIRSLYPGMNVITIPTHPGLTIIQSNLSRPKWMQTKD
jgi:hypothetical protein